MLNAVRLVRPQTGLVCLQSRQNIAVGRNKEILILLWHHGQFKAASDD